MREFQSIKLDNGLRVILVPQKQSLATTVIVLVEAGSKYETKDINGLSHFLEHMCFKGTKKRPHSIDISAELDSLGAKYNAFTTHEFTSYYAKGRNEISNKILEIIADLYLNPVFPAEEIEKEKGVIIEEMNMYEDQPRHKVQDHFLELVYGDQPVGWPLIGQKEVINKLTREDFIKYRAKHYLAQATTLVIAGGFDESEIMTEVKKRFSEFPAGDKGGKEKVKEFQEKPAELIKFKQSDQAHLVLGFRAFSASDERHYTLEVLADILGGGMSSRLWQKIREELGVAYYVGAGCALFSDHGLISMSAGVDNSKVETVITTGLKEFARLKNELVSEKELQRAKDHLIGNLFLSLETSDEVGYFYGIDEIMGLKMKTPEEVAEKINAVNAQDIKALAGELFKNSALNLALIGPFKDKKFSDILKIE